MTTEYSICNTVNAFHVFTLLCFQNQALAYTVHFIKKLTFRDHGTIMITSYYEKYYSVYYDYKLLQNVL